MGGLRHFLSFKVSSFPQRAAVFILKAQDKLEGEFAVCVVGDCCLPHQQWLISWPMPASLLPLPHGEKEQQAVAYGSPGTPRVAEGLDGDSETT